MAGSLMSTFTDGIWGAIHFAIQMILSLHILCAPWTVAALAQQRQPTFDGMACWQLQLLRRCPKKGAARHEKFQNADKLAMDTKSLIQAVKAQQLKEDAEEAEEERLRGEVEGHHTGQDCVTAARSEQRHDLMLGMPPAACEVGASQASCGAYSPTGQMRPAITSTQSTNHPPLTVYLSNRQDESIWPQSPQQQVPRERGNSPVQRSHPPPVRTNVPMTMSEREILMSPVNPHVALARDSQPRRRPQEHSGRQSPDRSRSARTAEPTDQPQPSTQHLSSEGSQSERASFTRIDSME